MQQLLTVLAIFVNTVFGLKLWFYLFVQLMLAMFNLKTKTRNVIDDIKLQCRLKNHFETIPDTTFMQSIRFYCLIASLKINMKIK